MPNWYPGDNAQGFKVFAEPALFAAAPFLQKGKQTGSFTITQPGTAGPGTAVVNNTGADCLVVVSGSQGLTGISTTQGTVTTGTVAPAIPVSVPVHAGDSINVTYGTAGANAVTWHWLVF